jgi:Papain fold toxin 1, glutamine deamidase
MDEWSGQPSVPASMTAIGKRLTELGPGSSAIVGCDWKDVNAGHWFNAVNDGGTLKTVEGQRNRVGSWPPVYREVGFDESMMRFSEAIFFNPNGKIVPNDNS